MVWVFSCSGLPNVLSVLIRFWFCQSWSIYAPLRLKLFCSGKNYINAPLRYKIVYQLLFLKALHCVTDCQFRRTYYYDTNTNSTTWWKARFSSVLPKVMHFIYPYIFGPSVSFVNIKYKSSLINRLFNLFSPVQVHRLQPVQYSSKNQLRKCT